MSKVVIIKGSKADLEWVEKIANNLIEFKVDCVKHIASAHKVPLKCYTLLKSTKKEMSFSYQLPG